MKRYTNFEDIDRDLKYLRLKSKINLEEIKFGFLNTQEVVKEAVLPANIISGILGTVAKRTIALNVINRLTGGFNLFGRRKKRK